MVLLKKNLICSLLIDLLTALRHISIERLYVPRNVAIRYDQD